MTLYLVKAPLRFSNETIELLALAIVAKTPKRVGMWAAGVAADSAGRTWPGVVSATAG